MKLLKEFVIILTSVLRHVEKVSIDKNILTARKKRRLDYTLSRADPYPRQQ